MKRKKPYLLAGLVLLLFLLCTACGNTEGQIAPQDDPNEGLGGGLSEDTVNDFSGFEGIWLGEADNDYDSMEFDAEGNWTLYLSGEVVDDGYLRYEPEWEAMPLWLAAALLVLSLSGIFLSRRYLRKPLQSVCVILCVLLAAACAAYIGLTLLFVDAVQNQPPAS